MDAVELKRGGLLGLAAAVYIPRRGRGARHYADTFSVALWLAKLNATLPNGDRAGEAYAPLWADSMAALVPDDTDVVTCPPRSRRRRTDWYLAEALARCVANARGVPFVGCLQWAAESAESSKAIVHQAGKGRALGRRAQCTGRLDGKRACLVDDLFTTGITSALCAEALTEAGAASVFVVTLAATERTEHRPEAERERIKERAERKRP